MRTGCLCFAFLTACSAKVGAPSKSGVVGGASAVYVESGATRSQSSAEAAFSTSADAPLSACTKTETIADCATLACAIPEDAAGTIPSAGTITMRVGDHTVVLAPGADHAYPAWQDASAALWAGGELLSIEAAGAEVPPFSGTLRAPLAINVRAPTLPPDGAAIPVAREAGIDVAWDPIDEGTVVLALTGASLDGRRAVVSCAFDAHAGLGSVPAAALRTVQRGDGSLTLSTRSSQRVEVGDYGIQLQADTQARTADGRRFTTLVSLD